jgi:hypothetical protein
MSAFLLEARDLARVYTMRRGLLGRPVEVRAVDGVSLRGEWEDARSRGRVGLGQVHGRTVGPRPRTARPRQGPVRGRADAGHRLHRVAALARPDADDLPGSARRPRPPSSPSPRRCASRSTSTALAPRRSEPIGPATLLASVGLRPTMASATRTSFRAASASGRSWRGRLRPSLACSSATSPSPRSTSRSRPRS